jgi:hypothetical protein
MWQNANTSYIFTNAGAGTYKVFVTDSDGCTGVDSIEFSGPEPLIPEFHVTDALCFGSSDGVVIAGATGGTMPSLSD